MRDDAATPPLSVSQRRAWASGLIVALFIALASALLPGSIPASQMVGSAFNPATTQVALNRDENQQTVLDAPAEDRQRPALGGDGHADVAILPAQSQVGAKIHYGASTQVLAASDTPIRPVAVRPGAGPRAPPLAA